MMTTVNVMIGCGSIRVKRDGDSVKVAVSSSIGKDDLAMVMTPAEAVELSNALAFVAGKAMRARKVNQTEVK